VKLLIVDDSSATRQAIARPIERAGCVAELTEAGDGAEALEHLARERFDLVLTDLRMPRLDGFELLARLREGPAGAAPPVVVVTTEATDAVRRRVLALGARACLAKPVSAEALARVIEDVLGR
jgi:two-component system chemotaxis response regulator CheY